MLRLFHFLCLLCWLVPGCPAGAAEVRTWKLPEGREVRAALTGIENGMAVLLPPNGNVTVKVATAALNAEDRAVVSRWVPPGRRPAGANAVVQRNAFGWPLAVSLREDPAITVVEQNREARRFVYRSDHFEFSSTQRLGAEIVREFSRLFEVTFETVAALPLNLEPEPQGYYKVILYATTADYLAAGAPKGSGGLFRSSTGEVMVPLPNLGVKRISERWIMESRDGNQPLIHEVTHQVMASWLSVLPIWAAEGSAEYLAAGRFTTGRLTLHQNFENMAAFLSEYKGVPGRDIDLRHPRGLLVMDHPRWSRDLAAGREGLKNYYSAMLTFYYFTQLDGDGSGRHLAEYFKARIASATPNDDTADRDRCLLRGRSWEALWADMQKAFAVLRIRIS